MKVGNITIDNGKPLVFIAGPCVIEDRTTTRKTARFLAGLARKYTVDIIFKASYDKANRSSIRSYRGPGIRKGLEILREIKDEFSLPLLTDVHAPHEVERAAAVVDVIQIPAFLCRQTDLLVAAGHTGKPVNIKKGQFIAPEDIIQAVKKVASTGNKRIIVTERGYSFGYHNLVVDMRSLEILKRSRLPVVFDATHAVQIPGGLGTRSGGERRFVFPLARAAVAIGIAAVFMEVHPQPARALSDGPNAIDFKQAEQLIKSVIKIDTLVKSSTF